MEKRRLKINKDKTVVMKSAKQRKRGIKVDEDKGGQLREVSCFKYLGATEDVYKQ